MSTNIFAATAAAGIAVATNAGPVYGLGCADGPGHSASLYFNLATTPAAGDTVQLNGFGHKLTGEPLRIRCGSQQFCELVPGTDEGEVHASITVSAGNTSAGTLKLDTGGGDDLGADHLFTIASVIHTPA